MEDRKYLFQVEYGGNLVTPLELALRALPFDLPISVHDLAKKVKNLSIILVENKDSPYRL